MKNKTRTNYNVFNYATRPLFTQEHASDIILFNAFSAIQTNNPLWIPATGKKICLTAVQTSAPAGLTVTLSRTGNQPFLSIVLTAALATYSESFPSPVRFAPDEIISLTTDTAGTMYITLVGYEV
ncbi:hypothetical protein [Sporomusa termitida]|uniref:Uncharacterized protein n=1 Tax=Sporomusa termitida TaxID=2377 RepID=A0A517DUZ2_9FIRM|nr:hypothetical protein [Sporomusa termitida]QDR81171.1 hypothetical protein SPTER_25440 [Sporomusa termitida]